MTGAVKRVGNLWQKLAWVKLPFEWGGDQNVRALWLITGTAEVSLCGREPRAPGTP